MLRRYGGCFLRRLGSDAEGVSEEAEADDGLLGDAAAADAAAPRSAHHNVFVERIPWNFLIT